MTIFMDTGAINNVAPSRVSAKALVKSDESLNGMTHRTADGTRIPNLGQKTLETVSDDGSTQLSQMYQIGDISRPLTSVGELADAGRIHREPRLGEAAQLPARGHWVYYFKTWSQEPVSSTAVCRDEIISTLLQSGTVEY